jgi:hypothetical protein
VPANFPAARELDFILPIDIEVSCDRADLFDQVEGNMVTVLWFVSLPVLVVFLIRWGWKAMPRWQQVYVLVGIPVIALASVVATADRLALLDAIPQNSIVSYALNTLFYIYVISVFWGVLVGCSQTWMLVFGTRASR